ncbi:MAG: hypothetical protein Fur0018_21960 [Anaerolineales bacterium]
MSTTTPNEDTNVVSQPIFEPFPEPNTMPSGWDLGALSSDPQPAPVSSTDAVTEA